MDKCCRTCRHFENELCFHPLMSTEEIDVYSEYVEPLFPPMNNDNEHNKRVFDLFKNYLKDNLPVDEMHFSPADHREFYCSLYE